MIPNWTLVLGVDSKHLNQLKLTYSTWMKYKPSLLDHPMIIFHDDSVNWPQISKVLHPSQKDLRVIRWPPDGVKYEGDPNNKWTNPQRAKMLSGFVHVAAEHVKTSYFLKIDTDTIASGMDDWVENEWFSDEPAIISHPWGFTKPPNQMMELDKWFDEKDFLISLNPPLNLIPNPGSSRVRHKRIISWCGFFNTAFTKVCSTISSEMCGKGKLPVPSQDGFMWYMAKRMKYEIRRENMKSRGWIHRSSMKGIRQAVAEVME